MAHKIDLRLAPALETLDAQLAAGAAGQYDFAFIDVDKTGYDAYYERCLQLLRPGGLVAIDNTLWSGSVARPAEDADTAALQQLNTKLRDDPRVDMSLLTIGDGLTRRGSGEGVGGRGFGGGEGWRRPGLDVEDYLPTATWVHQVWKVDIQLCVSTSARGCPRSFVSASPAPACDPERSPRSREADLRAFDVPYAYSARYGPRKRAPLKWIRCEGASATQTSVSHARS